MLHVAFGTFKFAPKSGPISLTRAPRFTVLTPTFNRADDLSRLFYSLVNQTLQDFEWILVDDGSTDATSELVADWARNSSFPIRYRYQSNQGKHVALNVGISEARGDFVAQIDSDDEYLPRALERFCFYWDSIEQSTRDQFVGVTGLCLDRAGELIGERFPSAIFDSTSLNVQYRNRITGDKCGFQRTEVLRKFRFPEPKVRTVVPEGIVWRRIALSYQTRFVNEPFAVCSTATDIQRLSRSAPSRYAYGLALNYEDVLNHYPKWLARSPKEFLRSGTNFVRFSHHLGRRYERIFLTLGLRRNGQLARGAGHVTLQRRRLVTCAETATHRSYRRVELRVSRTAGPYNLGVQLGEVSLRQP